MLSVTFFNPLLKLLSESGLYTMSNLGNAATLSGTQCDCFPDDKLTASVVLFFGDKIKMTFVKCINVLLQRKTYHQY